MSTEPRRTRQHLEGLVHTLAKDTARVVFTLHCQERMAQRGVSAIEVLRCLQRGVILRDPVFNQAKQNYQLRMSEPAPRDVVCVVAAISPTPEPEKLFAITVWEV